MSTSTLPIFSSFSLSVDSSLSQKTKDWEWLRETLLIHYNEICMQYHDSQIKGAPIEMEKWIQAFSYYLTLIPSTKPKSPQALPEWQKLKDSANALIINLHRLANPASWKAHEWVSLVSILGEAFTEYLSQEDSYIYTLENAIKC